MRAGAMGERGSTAIVATWRPKGRHGQKTGFYCSEVVGRTSIGMFRRLLNRQRRRRTQREDSRFER